MIRFRQKLFFVDAALNVGCAVLGHSQNKQAEKAGEEQLKQNEIAFKEQLKQQEEANKQRLAEINASQRSFTLGAVLGSTAAMVGVGAIQGHKGNKIAEEQGEAQMEQAEKFQKQQMEQAERFQKEQMKAQEKAAKLQAKAIEKAGIAQDMRTAPVPMPQANNFSDTTRLPIKLQRLFVAPSFLQKVGQTAFELGKTAKAMGAGKKIAHGVAMGSTMAALSYGVDKAITHDAKKSGLMPQGPQPTDESKKKGGLKKALITTGAIAGSALLAAKGAKSGKLGAGFQKAYENKISNGAWKGTLKSNATSFGKNLKSGYKTQFIGEDGKISKLGTALTLGFPAATAVGYIGKKKAVQSQIQQTESEPNEQRQYSIMTSLAKAGKSISRNYGKFKAVAKDPNQGFFKAVGKAGNKITTKSLDGVSKFMMGGGESGVNNFKNTLQKNIAPSVDPKVKQSYSQDIVNFVGKHKKTALAGSIGVGAMMFKPFNWGDKAVKTATGAVDKNAFAYEKSQNQQVPPQQ